MEGYVFLFHTITAIYKHAQAGRIQQFSKGSDMPGVGSGDILEYYSSQQV